MTKQKCARRLVSPGMEEMCQASNQIATFHEQTLAANFLYTRGAARLTCYPLAHLPYTRGVSKVHTAESVLRADSN
jgi:hypothetical protein